MKKSCVLKKVFLVAAVCCLFLQTTSVFSAELEWDGTSDIPAPAFPEFNTYKISSPTTITVVGNRNIDGTLTIYNGATLRNDATITIKGTVGQIINNGTIENAKGDSGTILVQGLGKLLNDSATSVIKNGCNTSVGKNGNITVKGTLGLLSIGGGTFYNGWVTSGITSAAKGTVTIDENGKLIIKNDAVFHNGYNFYSQIFVSSGATTGQVDFQNGTLNNGTAGAEGRILISGGFPGQGFKMENGTLKNQSNSSGRGIQIESGEAFLQNGGTIENGTSVRSGKIRLLTGGIFTQYSTFKNGNSNGGTIEIEDGLFDYAGGTFYNGFTASGNIKLYPSGELKIQAEKVFENGNDTYTGSIFPIFGGTINLLGIMEVNRGTVYPYNLTVGSAGALFAYANGTLETETSLLNNHLIVIYPGAGYINNGSVTNNGSIINYNNMLAETRPSFTTTIFPGRTLTVPQQNHLLVKGKLINKSSSSIEVDGSMYVYGTLENGDGSSAGTINVNFPGNLYTLGVNGSVENKNAGSQINVKSGGSFYNYYGDTDIGLGDMELMTGGKFHNARGTFPDLSNLTNNDASQFLDFKEVSLDKNLSIDDTWTVTGDVVINGNGHEINIGANGNIVLSGANASILFKDVVFNGISGTQIRCSDNNSTIMISNVTWVQDGDFTFDTGKLNVLGDWKITGAHKFNYESDQTSEIKNGATLTFKLGTFNYNTGTNSLISMENETAALHLDRATLLATQALSLSGGTVFTTGNVTLQGIGTLDIQGLENIYMHESVTTTGNVII